MARMVIQDSRPISFWSVFGDLERLVLLETQCPASDHVGTLNLEVLPDSLKPEAKYLQGQVAIQAIDAFGKEVLRSHLVL